MSAEVEEQEKKRELRSYIVGFVLAISLTALAFLVVAADLQTSTAYVVIGIAALAQVVVHFRFFLHISWQRSTRDDLQLILFTTLIIILMAGGTIWILNNLHHRMM
ncbi:cytochrome o ubiquinol oxidase subunit IV [Tianweitania sp. BSSL-BM11]|uniref:Cytochrome bo(3) ubiquinol oxidase subunit 4 n=1 Tax=Tianweitania aestuarii TaxID=2814886 RepID=A0ABS5RRJ5_9HYPH|nr:cytochrome o ubiquinol oxidase subunit IV [Tianweitania aestuarii]MBS9719678.1 cytochrome o ubiquinol oxidase subunit IV [Tianweitania aestuarii]